MGADDPEYGRIVELWLKPLRDAWDDPAMDIYDEVYSDPPTPSAIDTHYTDCAQLAQWRRECGKISSSTDEG